MTFSCGTRKEMSNHNQNAQVRNGLIENYNSTFVINYEIKPCEENSLK